MRILVADQNALLLAAIARTFGRHCEVVVATRRDACVAHIQERKFDVVVACENLSDYTGLELLSEVASLSPETVRIFAARPETLKRLGARLDYFGLLGTLSYPIDARKLLVALKTARGKHATPPKPLKPKVQHVVLDETEWDTGERLRLLERELETAEDSGAPGRVEAPLPAEAFGAANEPLFDKARGVRASVLKAPKVRIPTVPTAAQREAFQRAVARRNAARHGGSGDVRDSAAGSLATSGTEPFIPTQSLSDLARMAGTKQPLKVFNRTMAPPKRRAIVYGSGVAAAVLAAVAFQLMRVTPSEQERQRPAQDATAHLFSPPSTPDAGGNSPPPQVFTPTPPHVDSPIPATQGSGPRPFAPNAAPEDPPPPPAYQGPGPMEPPSMVHNGPPLEMQGPHVGD